MAIFKSIKWKTEGSYVSILRIKLLRGSCEEKPLSKKDFSQDRRERGVGPDTLSWGRGIINGQRHRGEGRAHRLNNRKL